MYILGLGSAVPTTQYAQVDCWRVVQDSAPFTTLTPRSRAILKKVLTGNSGIERRHLALATLNDAFLLDPDSLHARFVLHAPELATRAAEQALANAGTQPHEIDAILVSTCTGYLCPGLSSYVTERLGLRTDLLALDLVGHGCGAALPNLRTASALLSSGRCQKALSICVEVCSAALYLDNDPGVLVSACLFGDGAGAAVLGREHGHGPRKIKWITSQSVLKPELRDLLRFEQRSGMLRNLLSIRVPSLAANEVRSVFSGLISREALAPQAISEWILHPGGRDVLNAIRERLDLQPESLRHSEKVLREFGNLSSASIFFVLQEALSDSARPGFWWLSSFGAGFTCHGALLKVEE
jgi:predicted naringenin-chalcone synthase